MIMNHEEWGMKQKKVQEFPNGVSIVLDRRDILYALLEYSKRTHGIRIKEKIKSTDKIEVGIGCMTIEGEEIEIPEFISLTIKIS